MTVVVLALVAGAGIVLHRADVASTPAAVPSVVALPTLPTTIPYSAHTGPGATIVLTESVDPLTLAVPASWRTPAADPVTLTKVVMAYEAQAPALGAPLQAVIDVEKESGIRLFAYQPAAPHAFVSVISFSSPTAKPFTPSLVAAAEALAAKKTKGVAVAGQALPAGEALTFKTSTVVQNQPVVVEIYIWVEGGRTVEVQLVSETNVAAFPPLFDQIAASVRFK
ncbi:MAG TPA: hypothetical protein VHT30_06275 [Acidimicrobiales bacterium]|nr:hypothetical protein [Acidimicrobiales bacterium]